MRGGKLGTALAAMLWMAGSATAAVWYVDKDNASGVEDGLTWSTAYTTILEAIRAAHEARVADPDTPVEVWVAEGVYDEPRVTYLDVDSRDYVTVLANTGSLLLVPGVSVYGGFAGNETDRAMRPHPLLETVIDGSTARDGAPAIHVVVGAEGATLDGFTITGGDYRAIFEYTPLEYAYLGSGLDIRNVTSMAVRNCTFSDLPDWAVSLDYAPQVILEECFFPGTSVLSKQSCDIRNCVFTGAGARVRIEMPKSESWDNARITRCRFENHRSDNESALQVVGLRATISDCVFVGNNTMNGEDGRGGAISFEYAWGTVTNCLFHDNMADYGGAVAVLTEIDPRAPHRYRPVEFINCTFVRNAALQRGGAAYRGSAVFRNCIFWDNRIYWGNRPDNIDVLKGDPLQVDYCLIRETWAPDNPVWLSPPVRNFHTDPRFVNPEAGDFRLQPNSPAIDAGTLASAPSWDLDGNPRPQGARVDLGAYESPYWFAPDVTNDGQVNSRDIQAVVNAILGIPGPYATDVDGDGLTDAKDLQVVINAVLQN